MTATISTPELSEQLSRATWYDVGSPDDDHKLERSKFEESGDYIYMRKKQNPNQMYVTGKKDTNTWHCLKCQSVVLAARVAHTVRDGFFPLSGSGEVNYETVPYCPICEKKPDFHGSAVGP